MPPSEVARLSLGSLERAAMEAVWRDGRTSARELHDQMGGRLAYTTLMTTLDRLFCKGLLERTKQRRAYIYSARVSAEQLESGIAGDVMTALLRRAGNEVRPVLSSLVEAISETDRALLDDLEEMVQRERLRLRGKQ